MNTKIRYSSEKEALDYCMNESLIVRFNKRGGGKVFVWHPTDENIRVNGRCFLEAVELYTRVAETGSKRRKY